jgi:ABC-type transport system involved in multi-copper enzyme maturation permease subunit
LRSPDSALLRKEWRTMHHARAWLFVALLVGPLVGMAWRDATAAYTEMSGGPGASAALASALSPLDGIVSPLFGAYAVIATLLFPFVAIRTLSTEKTSGAYALLLQVNIPAWRHIAHKFLTLLGVWMAWWTPGLIALALWRWHGGHLALAETGGVLLGHLLHGAFVAALGLACAAVAESAASAAVLALAVTLGGWAIDFTASVRGGVAAALAPFTPDAMLRTFEHGLIAGDELLVALLLIVSLLVMAVIWVEPARARRTRLRQSGLLLALLAVALAAAGRVRIAWDVSEDRRNSFAAADAALLASISAPLDITVHLGPSDPRRADLEQAVLRKLQRVMPAVQVHYAAQSSTGLFAGAGSQYGEVWYAMHGKQVMSKSSTPAIVLETIYQLAGVPVPTAVAGDYPGYPARITAAPWELALAFIAWPVGVLWLWWRRRRVTPAARVA